MYIRGLESGYGVYIQGIEGIWRDGREQGEIRG